MTDTQFSSTIEHTEVYGTVVTLRYTPSSDGKKPITVSVAPDRGSNMFAFRYGESDIIYTEPELLKTCGFTGNFVLFPTPNRVKDAQYTWHGRTVRQKKHTEARILHGLVYDESWQFDAPIVSDDAVSVTTFISITGQSSLYESYPFLSTLRLCYTLRSSGVTVTYTVNNDGDEDMPFGFALHPYFSLLSGSENTYISVPAKSWMESPSDTLLPTGNLIDVSGKPYNINTPRPIAELSLDHVYTDLVPRQYATIEYRTLGLRLSLLTTEDFTHTVVYTGHKNAVCIENQTCSTDAVNLSNRGYIRESHVLTLKPDATHKGTISYTINSL